MFYGREGSSPIIDQLAQHPDIDVPLFEELDWYATSEICDEISISRLLALTFNAKSFEWAKLAFEAREALPARGATTRARGFKWRIWGEPTMVAKALADANATAFHLFRSDLCEMTASMYLTNIAIPEIEKATGADLLGGGHIQFAFSEKSAEEQQIYRDRINSIKFTADPIRFTEIMSDIVRDKEIIHNDYKNALEAQGVPVSLLTYEDFLADKMDFMTKVCDQIGVRPPLMSPPDRLYKKIADQSVKSRVNNWHDLMKVAEVKNLCARYADMMASYGVHSQV